MPDSEILHEEGELDDMLQVSLPGEAGVRPLLVEDSPVLCYILSLSSVRCSRLKKKMNSIKTPDLFDNFIKILRALAGEKVEYVLIGGFAVILHGLARLTADIDIFIKPEAENLGRLKRALKEVFPADKEIDFISLQDLRDYAVVRFGTAADFYIDIVAKIGEMFCYEDLEHEVRDIEGVPVRIATPETLFRMKKDTVRPEDKRDAWFLADLIAKRSGEKK
jgi:hypothetical protein